MPLLRGWEDYHLHVFLARWGERYGHEGLPETVTLAQVAPNVGDRLGYVYDFGDDRQLLITVGEGLGRYPPAARHRPRCIGGRRAAPPEDCGGPYGYADMLKILRSGTPRPSTSTRSTPPWPAPPQSAETDHAGCRTCST